MIPEESHVGLITFGTHVHVHELGFSECSKCFVFRGSKEYTSAQVGLVTKISGSVATIAQAVQHLLCCVCLPELWQLA